MCVFMPAEIMYKIRNLMEYIFACTFSNSFEKNVHILHILVSLFSHTTVHIVPVVSNVSSDWIEQDFFQCWSVNPGYVKDDPLSTNIRSKLWVNRSCA